MKVGFGKRYLTPDEEPWALVFVNELTDHLEPAAFANLVLADGSLFESIPQERREWLEGMLAGHAEQVAQTLTLPKVEEAMLLARQDLSRILTQLPNGQAWLEAQLALARQIVTGEAEGGNTV